LEVGSEKMYHFFEKKERRGRERKGEEGRGREKKGEEGKGRRGEEGKRREKKRIEKREEKNKACGLFDIEVIVLWSAYFHGRYECIRRNGMLAM
jgi:hypothetical protein